MHESQETTEALRGSGGRVACVVQVVLLIASAVLFALHFLHLGADFPNHSGWVDWSKYTDEGWYGDAAIRHYVSGHWYFPGDFNPAVALPVWPAMELVWFHFTGVSAVAARALTLVVFGITLVALYCLLQRHLRQRSERSGPSLAGALVVFLLCASPFLYVFERMAILEPLVVCLTVLAMLVASYLPGRRWWATVALMVLLPAMVLTKTTAVFLFPAVAYMLWARAGYRLRPALRLGIVPVAGGIVLWLVYFLGFVRPRYLADYEYLFSANAYTGIALEPLAEVVLNTFADGMWMGRVLYSAAFLALALVLFWRPRVLGNPVVPALLLWMGGYLAFLAYHNNLQPRYYLVLAVPVTAFVAIALDEFRHATLPGVGRRTGALAQVAVGLVVLAIVVPDVAQQAEFIAHPTYEFQTALEQVAKVVRADRTHPQLVLSISGSDLTLVTHVPSIDDDFGVLDLGQRVAQYRPGWYVAWNELDDDKADALTPLYHIERVAAFPALDDADRNLLIVYRLDPTIVTKALPRTKTKKTPKPLVTRLGQQPTTEQLQH